MFPIWRLKLHEVKVAADSGRYEDAAAMLERESLREFLPAKRLAQDLAGRIVARAGERLARGDSAAGWQDLAVADRLGGQGGAIGAVREQYAERALSEARRYLVAGQPAAARDRLDKLSRKGLLGEGGRKLLEMAALFAEAQRADEHGHFAEAVARLDRARQLAADEANDGDTMEIARRLDVLSRRLADRQQDAQRFSLELHDALAREDWSAVLTTAESLLAIAPRHEAARQARRRAWKAVGMDVTRSFVGRRPAGHVSLQVNGTADRRGRHSTRPGARSGEVDTVSGIPIPNRVMFWIDAVGGYLVCLDDEVVLGQPAPGTPIAVPILADLSRRHAVIRREAGAYVLEPVQRVCLDGRVLTGPTVLADGQKIQLGDSVRLRFTKPHALSATARLDIESHHKTQPSADAVILMSDSCVFGPSAHCHVRSRNWQHDVVLARQGVVFRCRSSAPLSVDGIERNGSFEVAAGERLEGENFSFTWERAEV